MVTYNLSLSLSLSLSRDKRMPPIPLHCTLKVEMTGRTMLHEACKLNFPSVVEALLYRGIQARRTHTLHSPNLWSNWVRYHINQSISQSTD